jgi:hypothetical protein
LTDSLPLHRWSDWYRKIPYGKIGFGYQQDPLDPYHIIPDPEVIQYIEQAFDYIDAGSSLREVCEWLSQKLLKSMVHGTVSNLYKKHRKPFLGGKKTKRKILTGEIVRSKEAIEKQKAKRAITIARKNYTKLDEKYKDKQIKAEDFPDPSKIPTKGTVSNLPHLNPDKDFDRSKPRPSSDISIVFQPNPGPQTDFLSATELEVLYGGSAGGGKSYAMLADPMRYFENPNFVGLLLRRTNDELRQLIWESQKIYPKLWPDAKWQEQKSLWTFPSGAKLWITYLDQDKDVQRYQGQEFCWIGMDELTQYPTPFAYLYLKSRLRSADPQLKKSLCMRATTNPGGPGHHWVKKMFIDPAPPNEAFWGTDIETGEVLKFPDNHRDPKKAGRPIFKRRFIPARLSDNPYLAEDGIYESNLLSLPEDQRRKLLEGDWSIVEGAAFAEFSPKHHVCKPFDIPPEWRRFRGADYGYSSPACVLWFAIDPAYDTLYVYRELYGSGMTGQDLARKTMELERGERISYGVLDSSVWHQRGHFGPSIAEEMIAEGCKWRPSDRGQGSRVAGKNRLHELLKVQPVGRNGEEKAGIIFFDTCRQIISDIPAIPGDPDGTDDIDSRYSRDHSYDALRYGIMSRPRAQSPLDWGHQPQYRYNPSDEVFGY